jgi:hypothetical protein
MKHPLLGILLLVTVLPTTLRTSLEVFRVIDLPHTTQKIVSLRPDTRLIQRSFKSTQYQDHAGMKIWKNVLNTTNKLTCSKVDMRPTQMVTNKQCTYRIRVFLVSFKTKIGNKWEYPLQGKKSTTTQLLIVFFVFSNQHIVD